MITTENKLSPGETRTCTRVASPGLIPSRTSVLIERGTACLVLRSRTAVSSFTGGRVGLRTSSTQSSPVSAGLKDTSGVHGSPDPDVYKVNVMNALERCKSRVSADEWEELMITYRDVFEGTPTEFHWKNGGRFVTEDLLQVGEDDAESDEETIEVAPARGLFQHYAQVERHRSDPEPSHLRVGLFVCLRTTSPSQVKWSTVDLPSTELGFRLAEVIRADRVRRVVHVQYYFTGTSVKELKTSTVFRPFKPAQPLHEVSATEPFLVLRRLSATGRLAAAYVRSIKYLLKCVPSDQPM